MIVFLPLLVALIGALTYALSNNGKVAEIGRILFWTGMLVFLFSADKLVTVIR
jgi:TM2 domain-containing membrane protein YozV